jgi:anti-sigma regulatory factor (Ser/Thr protein kinase)
MPSSSTKRAARRREATLLLAATPASVLEYEDFIDALDFLGRRERDTLKLAGEEILDNLIRHSAPLEGGGIKVRAARRKDRIVLNFFFRSPGFAAFAAGCGDPEPLFDPHHRRWRGIGMVMCRNLALSIGLVPGSLVDRIFMVFVFEPDEAQARPDRPLYADIIKHGQ